MPAAFADQISKRVDVLLDELVDRHRAQVVGCPVEGMSMRATTRVTGVAKQTVTDLLVDMGQACSEYQDYTLRNLDCKIIEADEVWAYCYSKQKNVPEEFQDTFGYGDVWTWTAIDAQTKLMPSWLVGERTLADCYTIRGRGHPIAANLTASRRR